MVESEKRKTRENDMKKIIVLDIGGIILDVSDQVTRNVLKITKKQMQELSKIVYGDKRWQECLLGYLCQEEYAKSLGGENPKYSKEIEVLLKRRYQKQILPVIQENLVYIDQLKKQGYKIYFLSNLTIETYEYLKEDLKLLDKFNGGIYSCIQHKKKPQEDIYECLLEKYQLKKDRIIFFDDTLKNIQVARRLGIHSILFKNISDLIKEIN